MVAPSRANDVSKREQQEVTDAMLHGLLSCMHRWLKYHACSCPSDVPYRRSTATSCSQFLLFVSQGGPTAAVNVYHAFKWFKATLGISLPVEDPLVAMLPSGQANGQRDHAAKHRTPIEIFIFVQLCDRMRTCSGTGTVKALVAWTLMYTAACLRFAHLQRSTDPRCDGKLLVASCVKGKRECRVCNNPSNGAWQP